MKRVSLVLCFFNMALIGYSQNLTVAVDNFTARSGYSEAELGNITELFAGFLLETRQFRVLTRSQWGAILKEQNFQLSGFVADEEIRKLGAALGASAVITGSLMKLGNSNILNISLLNVESGEMQSAAHGIVRGTYTYTNASLTLNYTITGTREYAIGSDNYYKDNNYNERGVCTVSYTISSNRRTITLDVRENELFHLLIREDYDRNDFREHRVNTLIKR